MKQKRGQSIPLLREPESQPARPLYVQLYRRVREGVLRGTIAPGTRLPSARTLASEEGISRNTVEAAFRQLQAEGFVERRVGAGTWVTEDLPERLLGRRDGRTRRAPASAGSLVKLSERGRELVGNGSRSSEPSDLIFAPCLPAAEAIPAESWNRIAARHLRRSKGSLDAPPPAGLPALREAVAEYLHLNRGVRCTADRVVILNSTQQAMNLAARLLLDPGDVVWLEDPGYLSARRAFRGARAKVHPVAVDDRGMDVAGAVKNAPDGRLVYVTPSHQYPMGVTLPLARRLELLEWAVDTGGWIFEDDYDSELRYEGRPIASIQGIDESGRVLYAGTFNKILFPGLRLAYLVLPRELVEPFTTAKDVTDGSTSALVQGVLADFMAEGHFPVHVRRVREVYEERRDLCLELAGELLPEMVRVGPAAAGMHVAMRLPGSVDDAEISARARRLGLDVPALSIHAVKHPVRGLLVHYGNATTSEIERGMGALGRILRESS